MGREYASSFMPFLVLNHGIFPRQTESRFTSHPLNRHIDKGKREQAPYPFGNLNRRHSDDAGNGLRCLVEGFPDGDDYAVTLENRAIRIGARTR